MSELEDLRREHAEETIGRRIADLLGRVVRATAPTYPPNEYSDARTWNREAMEDALQDWVTVRLLGRGDLARMLATATTGPRLRGMLTTSFGQFLVNRRQRTSATNLFQRVVRVLREDSRFEAVGTSRSSATQRWTLAAAPTERAADEQVLEGLVKAAASRSNDELEVVHYGPYSLKSSPILRNPQLADFLAFLLEQAGSSLSAADLFQVLRIRFNLTDSAEVELDPRIADGAPAVVSSVETTVLAESVLARLGRERALLIRHLHAAGGDPQRAAEAAGVSQAEMASALDHVMALIADYAETSDEAIAVYRRLTESLFVQGEDR
jgi:hypothetical protein